MIRSFFLTILLSGLVPVFSNELTITLHERDHASLGNPEAWWGNWLRFEGGWFVLVNSTPREGRGAAIYRWNDQGELTLLAATTPREGIYSFAAQACEPSGRTLYVKGWRSPWLYTLSIESLDEGFSRYALTQHCDALAFLGDGRLVVGSKYPDHKIEHLRADQRRPLDLLMSQLPDDATHDVESNANGNRMVIAGDAERIAVSYTLYPKVIILEYEPSREAFGKVVHPIKFKGYKTAPKNYIQNPGKPRAHLEWVSSFHSLVGLRWHRDNLFGKLRKGLEGFIWISLDSEPPGIIWDNNKEKRQLLAMGSDEVVWGEWSFDTNDEIEWKIWRTSSF